MYPRSYYETFLRYEASNEVFVAIPFSPQFEAPLNSILIPAIRATGITGAPLAERVVNRGTAGAADIHEMIFDGIVHSRLVIADMTVQASFSGVDGRPRWQPNANVAYEVGLASAWRNPEDVLLVHQASEEHSYSFDVQNLRHIAYDIRDTKGSIDLLAEEIRTAISRSTFIAQQSYQRLVQSVPPAAVHLMHAEAPHKDYSGIHFKKNEVSGLASGRALAIGELVSIGALRAAHIFAPENDAGSTVIYRWTELGLRLLLDWHVVPQERIDVLRKDLLHLKQPISLLKMGKPAVEMAKDSPEQPRPTKN